jgi:hypothetical protein
MATPAQLEANRANAQLSTGPSSPEGKAKCSHNALKTGLTGRTILLPGDDVTAYENFVAIINKKFQPETDEEKLIVQSIADTEWRLLRIPTLEAGLYALGRNELASECPSESDPQVRASMIEALIFRTYKKDLNNLVLQERRLRNQLKEHTAELFQLQASRDAVEFQRRNKLMMNSSSRIGGFKPPANALELFGFEFTEEYLDTRLEAHHLGGQAAVMQFDRAWKTKYRKQAA